MNRINHQPRRTGSRRRTHIGRRNPPSIFSTGSGDKAIPPNSRRPEPPSTSTSPQQHPPPPSSSNLLDTLAAPHRRWRRRRCVDSRPKDGDPTPHAQHRRHAGRAGGLPQIHRHCATATRRSRIWEDQKTKRAAAAPTKTTAPATHTHTLFTHQTHRSGVPPPFRRRSGRRRGGEPAAAPGKRGEDGVALSVASLNCSSAMET
jgi:hypothetical protein